MFYKWLNYVSIYSLFLYNLTNKCKYEDRKKTQVFGFESALRGMRNPKNSWGKIDNYLIRLILKK